MKTNLLIASAIVLAVALATPAYAQTAAEPAAAETAPAADDTEILGAGDIIVTATKRSESVNTVPMSITAATGDTLLQAGITDVSGLAKLVPGFNAVDSSYGTPVYYLRGVGFFETSLMAKPTVGVYVDEMPVPFSAMSLGASMDLERVEVLKGPQGTLFGSNATGGAINYIAAKPTDSAEAGFYGSFGRFSEAKFGGFVSGPITDTISARLAVNHEMRDDWQRSVTRPGDTAGSRNFSSFRAQLAFKPGERFRALVSVSGFLDKSDTQQPQFQAAFQQTPTTVLIPGLTSLPALNDNARQSDWTQGWPLDRNNKMIQLGLRADYDVTDNLTLTSLTSYAYFKEDQYQDADGTPFRLSDYRIYGNIKSLSQELRIAGDFDNLKFVVGANYERSKGPENQIQYLADQTAARSFIPLGFPAIPLVPVIANNVYTSKAIFGNVDFDIGDMLTLHAGARYTETNTDFNGCVGNDPANILGQAKARILAGGNPTLQAQLLAASVASGCNTVLRPTTGGVTMGRFFGELPENNVSWRVGADFKPARGQLIYVNVSRGYKAGSFANLAGSDANQYIPVVQEELTAYELGFKSSLLDRRVQLNGAAFYYDYTDKQLKGRASVPIFGFLEALVNIPKSRIQGAELQLVAEPTDGLRLTAGGTYIDSKITSAYSNYNLFGQVISFKGAAFPYTPKWQLNGDINYSWDISGKLGAFVGASATYKSSTNGDFQKDARVAVDAYTLIDLRAGLEAPDGAWRVNLYGRNITDKYYWVTATRRSDALVRFAGMPATYGVEFNFRFK